MAIPDNKDMIIAELRSELEDERQGLDVCMKECEELTTKNTTLYENANQLRQALEKIRGLSVNDTAQDAVYIARNALKGGE